MKHDMPPLAPRLARRSALAVLAMSLTAIGHAAPTDISQTPIITTTAALVKPNVMLLMDASGSMGRTHMPDEVETQTRPASVGYKSSQCNALYYNPSQAYFLPKRYDGTPFPLPSFAAAPYAGFGSYYTVADLRITNLNTAFVAFDGSTLEIPAPVPDPAQAAYYYVYSGPEPLSFATAPCTQFDTGATAATPGGGVWTKVNVTLLGAPEQQNFAIWYSFYRTRIALIKSAASLAFAPLTDTKRVGFITVQPKASPGDSGIAGTTGNWPRYLPINDFNGGAGGQKDLWFRKLFSQSPGGASPAREGLARVGRYYGGKEDGINANMPASGVADPVQYACQQNFTIMTTDGYWNGQTESTNVLGGGVNLLGDARVGQQDGVLSDPYSPRPIWDGTSNSIRVVTDKTNAYTDNVCSLSGRYRSTFQSQREVSTLTKDTTRTTKRTVQYFESKSQAMAATDQTSYTLTYDYQSTRQFVIRRDYFYEEKYKHVKRQEQTTKTTQQYELQTSQVTAQTFQTRQVDKRIFQTTEQWQTAKSQSVETTTQYKVQRDQYNLGREQLYKHQYQTIAKIGDDEVGVALAGDCTPGPGVRCEIRDYFASQLVDPSTCTTGPGPDVGPPPGYLKTTCINGPMALPYGPVPNCTPGVTPAVAGNGFVKTTCDLLAGSPTPLDGTCSVGPPTQDAGPPYYLYTCTRPAATNAMTPVAACGAVPPYGAPDYILTTCGQPPGPNNQPPTPSLPCTVGPPSADPSFVTTTCTKPIDTSGYVATCTPDPGTSGSFIKVTCGAPETLADDAVPQGSCTPAVFAGFERTCPRTPAGAYPSATPVASCTNGATTNAPDHFTTTCDSPSANNVTAFVTPAACGTPGVTPGTFPSWITRDCRRPAGPNNQSGFADPRTCTPNDGSAPPYLRVDCPTVVTMPTTPVPPASCPFGTYYNGGPDFTVTYCERQNVSPRTDVAACTTDPDPLVVTICGTGSFDTPVASCVPGPLPPEGIYTVTCLQNDAGPTQVATCTPADGSSSPFVRVTCAGSRTDPPVVLYPGSCSGTYYYAPYILTCSTNAVAPYPTPTAVPSCTGSIDGSYVRTSCTYPPVNNYAATPVAPCTVGTVVGPDEVRTTCSVSDVTDFVPTSACPASVAQSGTGPEITCTTTPTLGTPVATCTAGAVDPVSPYDTTTRCNGTVVSPMADYAGECIAGPTGTPGEVVRCNLRGPIDNLVSDSGCADGTNTSTGLVTQCTTAFGSGRLYSVSTTTTVTTTPYSGTAPSGPDAVSTSTSASAPVDGVCYPTPQTFTAQPVPPAPSPPTTCAPGPAYPCVAVTPTATGSENSLADVSQYYYRTDLRPSMVNNVPSAGTGVEDDNAPHQHMTTFTLGLGVSGTLNYRTDYRALSTLTGDFAAIRVGTKNWPLWPDPMVDYTNPDNYNSPKSIDDFWHTAVNGRGRYFSANNPTSVVQGLADALAKINDVVASGTADSTSTLQPVAGNNFAYSTSYQSGSWQGDVEARLINLSSGALGVPVWSAKALLGGHTFADCDDRKIFLLRGGTTLVPFTWETQLCPGGVPLGSPVTSLNGSEQGDIGAAQVVALSQYPFMTDGLGSTALQQQEAKKAGKLVNFVRGHRGNEDFETNSLTKLFRHREAVLGDIVDSQPVYVGQPFASYQENSYSTFKFTPRTPMLYVGANDGMLHAFYATVDTTDANRGQEAWAVIPSAVLPNLYKLADDNYKRDGHQFYVDGTPVAGDVWNGSQWKTILVGGLNAGGKGFYALDISAPGATPTPLWEFKQSASSCPAPAPAAMPSGFFADCNLGLSFGKPIITKLAGAWVVIVTSGYNNANGVSGDGGGFLYVLDALTGELKQKIATGAGDATTPSGLAQINNFVDDVAIDNTTLRAYGGDVLGNIWRFEFSPPSATLIGVAKDATNVIEPITIRPELAEIDGKPFIMVGTGRLLGGSDIGVTGAQKQSVYGIRDPLTGAAPIYDPLRSFLRPLAIAQTGSGASAVRTLSCTGSAGDCARPAGWVIDLPEVGERVNVEMKVILGTLVFASNVPEQVPCSIGGHSWLNYVDFRTGAIIPGSSVSTFLGETLNVGFNILELPLVPGGSNPARTVLYRQSNATSGNAPPPIGEPAPLGKRISWREISQ